MGTIGFRAAIDRNALDRLDAVVTALLEGEEAASKCSLRGLCPTDDRPLWCGVLPSQLETESAVELRTLLSRLQVNRPM